MLLSRETSDAMDILVGAFFDMNRTLDRCVSVMINKWTMPNASDIIHHKLAHLMPLLADKLVEVKDHYNEDTIYPETHRDARDYANLEDMFSTVMKEFEEIHQMIKMTNDIAVKNGDFGVHSWLVDFMEDFIPVFGQIVTLRDKAIQMPDNYDKFDNRISKWGIVGMGD